jgi:predicted dinucleotide-utilizing enzyme
MTIGVSILVMAVGAILKFAVADNIEDVDLQAVGVILMIAGAVGLVAGLIMAAMQRREVVHTTVSRADPPPRV